MTAAGSDPLERIYRDWNARIATNPQMRLPDIRAVFDEVQQSLTAEPAHVTYEEARLGGVPGIWCVPTQADRASAIQYIHGGGFAFGSPASHRKLAGHLARALGARAFVVDYRRSPEHRFPAQLNDNLAVFQALTQDVGLRACDIVACGDSAGGNIAIAITLKLRDAGNAPGAVIAFSPWFDMELCGRTLDANDIADGLIRRTALESMRSLLLGKGNEAAWRDPLVNPLHADFAGFPRLYLSVGSCETLRDDSERLHARAIAAGADSTLRVAEGQQHVFVMMAGRTDVADRELQRVAEWYRMGISR